MFFSTPSKRNDPVSGLRFWVEIDGLYEAGFTEVSGLVSETEVEEYQEGGVNGYTHRLPGRVKYSSIVLKRGFSASPDLWDWYSNAANGEYDRRNGAIVLQDGQGEEVCRWNFYESYPIKWKGPDLDASSSMTAIEEIELAHHGIKTVVASQDESGLSLLDLIRMGINKLT